MLYLAGNDGDFASKLERGGQFCPNVPERLHDNCFPSGLGRRATTITGFLRSYTGVWAERGRVQRMLIPFLERSGAKKRLGKSDTFPPILDRNSHLYPSDITTLRILYYVHTSSGAPIWHHTGQNLSIHNDETPPSSNLSADFRISSSFACIFRHISGVNVKPGLNPLPPLKRGTRY